MKKAKILFKVHVVFVALTVGATVPSFATDPLELQDQRRQNEPKQPDQIARPDAGPIGGADIREHRDKVNAVKAQVFKAGATPTGVTFRAAVANGEAKPGSYVAEARFGDFSQQVKQQVVKELGTTPPPSQRVGVLVDIRPDAVTVVNARLADVTPKVSASLVTAPGQVAPLNARPGSAQPQTPAMRPVRDSAVPPSIRSAATQPSHSAAPPIAGPEARQNTEAQKSDAARPTVTPAMPLPMTVRTAAAALVGDRNVTFSANTISLEPTAVIPTVSGRDLSVRTKDVTAGVVRVELSGRSGDIPPVLKAQIQADLGQTALPARADAPVTVTLDVMPDRSIRAVDARTADVPTVSRNRVDAPGVAAAPSDVASARNSAPAAPAEHVPQNAAPSLVAPQTPAATSPFPAVGAAQTLALMSGLSPSTVRLQAPKEERTAVVSVPVQGGREIRVEAVRAEERAAAPTIHAEGRLGDFSPKTRSQVLEVMGKFKAASLVNQNTSVILETRPPEGDKVVVTAIAVKLTEAANAKPVLMWRETDARQVAAPEAVPAAAQPDAQPVAGKSAPVASKMGTPVNSPVAAPGGLVTAAAKLAVKAYGIPEGGFDIKVADNKGNLKIDPVAPGKPSIPFNYRVDADGRGNFDSTGKPVDFTDTIREQVYEKLRSAVENGETWASEVMKGGRQVKVEFIVDAREADSGQVRVKSVAPTAKDAAVDSAREMGLADGDFFVVNLGQQALIVLEQGKTASVRIGDGIFNIVSPDGNAKIFVRPGRTKKDHSAVFMLSKDSLKANRMTLIRAGGAAAAAAIKAAMEANPNASEYIVNLDLAADEKIAIRAMMNGQLANGFSLDNSKKKPDAGE